MPKVVSWMQGGDKVAFLQINRVWKCSFTDWLMPLITNFGGAVWSVALSLILLFSENLIIHQVGKRLAISLLVSHLIVRLGKKLLPRLRPYLTLEDVNTGRKIYKDPSFPSGHSTAAFCTATVLSSAIPAFSIMFFTMAVLVAVSRIYLGMHYPSDITAGALIGICVAQLVI
jgi:undecaprenyl-diphosphatase